MSEWKNSSVANRLYSIVVPIYGVERYIVECIESIIKQTYRNIEIILVDDGSKDNSPEICDYYKEIDHRIVVLHKTNGGLVSARKAGAKVAKGEYVFCVDGDDWISNRYIEKFDQIISKYNPEVVCCGYVRASDRIFENKGVSIKSGFYDEKSIIEKIHPIAIENNKGVHFSHSLWAKAFKRELYVSEQLLVNDKIKIGEDAAVVKPILTKCKSMYVLEECLYYYRCNDNSMTKHKVAFEWRDPICIYYHLNERINVYRGDFHDQIYRYAVRGMYVVALSQFNSRDNYQRVKGIIMHNITKDECKFILDKCKYSHLKQKIEHMILKYHLIFLLYVISKTKQLIKVRYT